MSEIVPISILAGVGVDVTPDLRVEYPVNMVPSPPQDGITEPHLRPAEGILALTTGQGLDRAGIVWRGAGLNAHYRVSGTKLIKVLTTGAVPTVIGDVGGSGHARLAFSFDRLGILSGGKLWFWDNTTFLQVTSPNIPANLIDMTWIDGYWIVTDGSVIAVSDLAAPTTFNPLKFGTTDRPDPVKSLHSVLNELHVGSQNFIDIFQNIGGSGFPFQRVSTAVITKGVVDTRASCVFNNTVAFVGGGRGEAPSVWLGRNAQTVQISSHEIDKLLGQYTTAQLSEILVESVFDRGGQFIFVHLPDRTVVYDAIVSGLLGRPIWHIRVSTLSGFAQYRARNITRVSDTWVVGDPTSSAIGKWNAEDSQHYGMHNRCSITTLMLRSGGRRAIVNSIELLGLTGVTVLGTTPRISTSYTTNGRTYSLERSIESGESGDMDKRMIWRKQGKWNNYRIQRFQWDSSSHISVVRLDAEITVLRW